MGAADSVPTFTELPYYLKHTVVLLPTYFRTHGEFTMEFPNSGPTDTEHYSRDCGGGDLGRVDGTPPTFVSYT